MTQAEKPHGKTKRRTEAHSTVEEWEKISSLHFQSVYVPGAGDHTEKRVKMWEKEKRKAED